jgi:hypothetical protein
MSRGRILRLFSGQLFPQLVSLAKFAFSLFDVTEGI